MIVRNKAEVKQCIMEFLEANTEDISLAYLLVVLIKTKHIKSSVKYMTFHRAMNSLLNGTTDMMYPKSGMER